jgi:hypothetical protein
VLIVCPIVLHGVGWWLFRHRGGFATRVVPVVEGKEEQNHGVDHVRLPCRVGGAQRVVAVTTFLRMVIKFFDY